MSQDHSHLNHATWECKYHVVFTPKYRKKALFGQIRRHLGTVFHDLARRKECQIEEGHMLPDHVHMLISIPPKYSVAEVIGYLKGKSSIWIAQNVERIALGKARERRIRDESLKPLNEVQPVKIRSGQSSSK